MSKFRTLTRAQVDDEHRRLMLALRKHAADTDALCREALLDEPARPRHEVMYDLYGAVWMEIAVGQCSDRASLTLDAIDELAAMKVSDAEVTVIMPTDPEHVTRDDMVQIGLTMHPGQVLVDPKEGPLMFTARDTPPSTTVH